MVGGIPTEIAATVGMPPTTLSHYIRAMRDRGHLVERRNPQDSRSRMLALSVSGRAAHRRANRAFEEAYRRFMQGIGDEAGVKAALAQIESAAADGLTSLTSDTRARTG